MNRKTRIIGLAVVIVAVFVLTWRTTVNRLAEESEQVSDAPLSQGIGERWGGGLPGGFTESTADDLDTAGRLFARLRYTKSVDDLLKAWDLADEALRDEFSAMVDAHLAAEIPAAHREILSSERPSPDGTWRGYAADGENGARIILLYDRARMELYLAEYQPKTEGTP